MKAILLGFGVLVIIGVGGYFIMHHTSNTAATTLNQSQSSSSASQQTADTITYSSHGFSPANLTVKTGATVTIKNTTSEDMQLDSDPHPVHTDDTDLNVGLVAPGQSRTFVVTKTGTFGYHNHLDPSDKGLITIQ